MSKFLKLLFSRLVITCILIFLQFLLLLGIIWDLSSYFIYFYAFFTMLSLLITIYVLNKSQSPNLKLPWIIIIMVFPMFGGLLYVMFGNNKMGKKEVAIAKELIPKVKELSIQNNETMLLLKKQDESIKRQAEYIYRVTGSPVYQNTQTTYLPIGEEYIKSVLIELKKAKKFIFLEYFIIEEGKMWNDILEILIQKVKDGVDVRVMYDDIGCIMKLPFGYSEKLKEFGIKCVIFNPFHPVLSIGHNNRDHRKILVIDGNVAFTGGINLADEYINAKTVHGHWKDTGMMLRGKAVQNFTLMFLESWNFYCNEDSDFSCYMQQFENEEVISDGFVQPFGDSPLDNEGVSENAYINMISNAKEYIYINTPYLIIDYNLELALCTAAKKGVDVRITTPYIPDKWYVHAITQFHYKSLIKAGVKVYEYLPGFIHAKSFVCDDVVGIIGTINLDYRSLVHHFECGVWMYQTKTIADLKEDYLETLNKCMEVTLEYIDNQPFYKRWTRSILQLFAPLM